MSITSRAFLARFVVVLETFDQPGPPDGKQFRGARFVLFGPLQGQMHQTFFHLIEKGVEVELARLRRGSITQVPGEIRRLNLRSSRALAEVRQLTGVQKLDLIRFDSCLMGQIDVLHAVAPFGELAVGSADLDPG